VPRFPGNEAQKARSIRIRPVEKRGISPPSPQTGAAEFPITSMDADYWRFRFRRLPAPPIGIDCSTSQCAVTPSQLVAAVRCRLAKRTLDGRPNEPVRRPNGIMEALVFQFCPRRPFHGRYAFSTARNLGCRRIGPTGSVGDPPTRHPERMDREKLTRCVH
jgi:hypothetical protein